MVRAVKCGNWRNIFNLIGDTSHYETNLGICFYKNSTLLLFIKPRKRKRWRRENNNDSSLQEMIPSVCNLSCHSNDVMLIFWMKTVGKPENATVIETVDRQGDGDNCMDTVRWQKVERGKERASGSWFSIEREWLEKWTEWWLLLNITWPKAKTNIMARNETRCLGVKNHILTADKNEILSVKEERVPILLLGEKGIKWDAEGGIFWEVRTAEGVANYLQLESISGSNGAENRWRRKAGILSVCLSPL